MRQNGTYLICGRVLSQKYDILYNSCKFCNCYPMSDAFSIDSTRYWAHFQPIVPGVGVDGVCAYTNVQRNCFKHSKTFYFDCFMVWPVIRCFCRTWMYFVSSFTCVFLHPSNNPIKHRSTIKNNSYRFTLLEV